MIQKKAKELYDAMEQKERTSGEKYYCLKEGSPEWMRNVIHKAHGDRLPDDNIYEVITTDILPALMDANPDADIDDLREVITQIEPDVYTGELTSWLAKDINNICYLTKALQDDPDLTDGFLALATAQQIFKEEIGNIILEELKKEVIR